MCNALLRSGQFPDSHKHSVVFPRLKTSLDSYDLNSYRPILNLNFILKLVERVVTRRFITHVETNKLFPVKQSAYRQQHSTESAVVSVMNDIIRSIDDGKVVPLALVGSTRLECGFRYCRPRHPARSSSHSILGHRYFTFVVSFVSDWQDTVNQCQWCSIRTECNLLQCPTEICSWINWIHLLHCRCGRGVPLTLSASPSVGWHSATLFCDFDCWHFIFFF